MAVEGFGGLEVSSSRPYSTSWWSGPLTPMSKNLELVRASLGQSWILVQEDSPLKMHVWACTVHRGCNQEPTHQKYKCMAWTGKPQVTCSMVFPGLWVHGHAYSRGLYWYRNHPTWLCCSWLKIHFVFSNLCGGSCVCEYTQEPYIFKQTTASHWSLRSVHS